MNELSINQFDRDVIRALAIAGARGVPMLDTFVFEKCEVCERDEFNESVTKLRGAGLVGVLDFGRIYLTMDGMHIYNQIDQEQKTIR